MSQGMRVTFSGWGNSKDIFVPLKPPEENAAPHPQPRAKKALCPGYYLSTE